ncbi:MAG TPA: AbrB/MazE/SpoVT family DNA-binding domain-containing protein [Candidatus Acidoferrales bacterium]|nr:AbrB/MazE/SpoVT family DNA-binding domain-containing protein [Candidatus Acidoferrales bacterium]
MVDLKVRKIGNSLGVVLPKETVSRLGAQEGDRLFLIEGPNRAYQLTPHDPTFVKTMKKAEDIRSRYRNTPHALFKRVNRCGSTSVRSPGSMRIFRLSKVVPWAYVIQASVNPL